MSAGNVNTSLSAAPKMAAIASKLRAAISPNATQLDQSQAVTTATSTLGAVDTFLNQVWQRMGQTPQWISDTHANRTNWPAANFVSTPVVYPVSGAGNLEINSENGLYYETDRNVFYRSLMVSNVPTWVYLGGVMLGVTAALPGDLGTNDVGFLFIDTTAGTIQYWNGTTWITIAGAGGGVVEHIQTLTTSTTAISVPAGVFPTHTIFILVVTQDATGGRLITFNAGFKLTTTAISPYPAKSTLFTFMLLADTNWWMISDPVRQL